MFFNSLSDAIAYVRGLSDADAAALGDSEVWRSGSGEVCIDGINRYFIESDETVETEFALIGLVREFFD
jgi:hypothetical protein